jgi:hypothetical protein
MDTHLLDVHLFIGKKYYEGNEQILMIVGLMMLTNYYSRSTERTTMNGRGWS